VITQIQNSVGEHFASVQGGVFGSKEVAEVMHYLEQNGAVAIGQTSWGPTGFCMVDSTDKANRLLANIQQKFSNFKQLSFVIASARNCGGTVVSE
jgi:predicted sugar kinase